MPENLSDCDDTEVIINAIRYMPEEINIKAAGTAMRFMTAYLSVMRGTHTLTGTERMKHRPIGVLVDALLKYETLNRAEFLSVLEKGTVEEGLGNEKPRTTAEVLEEARDVLAAEEKEREEAARQADAEENNDGSDGGPELLN